jgi:hypothetical protein
MASPIITLLDPSNNVAFQVDGSGNANVKGNLVVTGNVSNNAGAGITDLIAKINLSSAQLLALRATPVSLVAAPGAGKYNRVISVDMHYTFVTGAYTNTNAALKVFYGTTASAKPLTSDQTALLTQTVNAHNIGIVTTANVNLTDALGLNVAIFLGNDNSAEFLVGAGTLEVIVTYVIITP